MGFGIVHPEMMALRIGLCHVGAAHPLHFVQQRAIRQRGASQFSPVIPAATRNHVVNRGEGEVLVVEVPMFHGLELSMEIEN
jgi:hypothetical protein